MGQPGLEPGESGLWGRGITNLSNTNQLLWVR